MTTTGLILTLLAIGAVIALIVWLAKRPAAPTPADDIDDEPTYRRREPMTIREEPMVASSSSYNGMQPHRRGDPWNSTRRQSAQIPPVSPIHYGGVPYYPYGGHFYNASGVSITDIFLINMLMQSMTSTHESYSSFSGVSTAQIAAAPASYSVASVNGPSISERTLDTKEFAMASDELPVVRERTVEPVAAQPAYTVIEEQPYEPGPAVASFNDRSATTVAEFDDSRSAPAETRSFETPAAQVQVSSFEDDRPAYRAPEPEPYSPPAPEPERNESYSVSSFESSSSETTTSDTSSSNDS